MKRRITVRGIIIDNTGRLFCQRLTAREADGRDFWCTPGGGLDPQEELRAGLRREMIEETGIAPQIGRLLFIQQFTESGTQSAHGPSEQLEFFFHILNWRDYQQVDLAATSHGTAEVAACGFIDPRTTHVLPAVLSQWDLTTVAQWTDVPIVSENLR